MKKTILLCTLLSLAHLVQAQENTTITKDKFELIDVTLGSNYLIERLGKTMDIKVIHLDSLTFNFNESIYDCNGTRGSGIRCYKQMNTNYNPSIVIKKNNVIDYKMEIIEANIDTGYFEKKFSSVFNTEIINFNEMIIKINDGNYSCGGAGGQIRCQSMMK